MVCPALLSVCSPRPRALGPKCRKGSDAMGVPEYTCSLTSPQVGPDPKPLLGSSDAIRSVPTLRSQGSRCGQKDPDYAGEQKYRSRWGMCFFVVRLALLSVYSPRPLALGPKRREGADTQKLKILQRNRQGKVLHDFRNTIFPQICK
jgi:hypothetical protein